MAILPNPFLRSLDMLEKPPRGIFLQTSHSVHPPSLITVPKLPFSLLEFDDIWNLRSFLHGGSHGVVEILMAPSGAERE